MGFLEYDEYAFIVAKGAAEITEGGDWKEIETFWCDIEVIVYNGEKRRKYRGNIDRSLFSFLSFLWAKIRALLHSI